MGVLWWILLSGLVMSLFAFVGAVTFFLGDAALRRILLPLVAFAAGSLVGGALFHLLPEGVHHHGPGLAPYVWLATGFLAFLLLEQLLSWHHCHRAVHDHTRPLNLLILVADGLHNLIGGLAVGGCFVADVRLGITAWLVAAAHEVPQELGDFGILVHGGWSRGRALLFNFLSALTFPLGGVLAWLASARIDVAFLLPFAAGNFLYIGAVDLVPELGKSEKLGKNLVHVGAFALGMVLLLLLRALGGEH